MEYFGIFNIAVIALVCVESVLIMRIQDLHEASPRPVPSSGLLTLLYWTSTKPYCAAFKGLCGKACLCEDSNVSQIEKDECIEMRTSTTTTERMSLSVDPTVTTAENDEFSKLLFDIGETDNTWILISYHINCCFLVVVTLFYIVMLSYMMYWAFLVG